MPDDGTVDAAHRTHPCWCDPSECTVVCDHPYGAHQSASQFVAAEVPSGTAIELHLTSLFKGVDPSPLLLLEFADREDDPTPYLLTLSQASRLRDTLGHLLTIAAPNQDQTGTAPSIVTSAVPAM